MTNNFVIESLFSKEPGPRERHLQRKFNNPLFGANSEVSKEMIHAAQRQDHSAMQEFMLGFRELVQRAVKLDASVESDVILLLKAQLEQQYAVCTGLPGQPAAIQEALKKLIAAISSTLRSTSKDDPHALEKLAKDEEHTQLHLHLCEYMIVSDMLNPDDIISDDEKLPSLLNEGDDALQAALALFPPQRIAQLVDEGKLLLEKIEAGGCAVPLARQNLRQMEAWLQDDFSVSN
jgi:hypothetical protein